MPEGRWTHWLLLVVLIAGLAVGLAQLVRMPTGTAYPRYSSMRTDAAGTALLYSALGRVESINAERNYLPLDQVRTQGGALFYLGVHPHSLKSADATFAPDLEAMAKRGNRVVVGVTDGPAPKDAGDKNAEAHRDAPGQKSAESLWNVRVETQGKSYRVTPGPEWTSLGATGIWERRFGSGSIVLVTDAQRLLNEALARSKDASALVPLLIGDQRTVIFEESHLGVADRGSVAGLARRYRLGGLLAGLLVLTGLFVWRNAVPFPPQRAEDEDATSTPITSNSQAMLVGLLQRHMTGDALLEACVAEWNRMHPERRLEAAAGTRQDPVLAYRAMHEQVRERRKKQV